MAKLIPSGVIQLPNFAELQYKLNEREREKQLQFDDWSAQFTKKSGTYLDGDREAVQTAYGAVENSLKELARDPDNIDLRRKVREANAGYNEVAGTAQFLADNYRQQWSAYNTKPDQFDLGGRNASELFDAERTTKRDANQIMSLAANPFTLLPRYNYDMQSPTQIADEAANNFRKNINDYILPDGRIDEAKAREYMNNFMSARYIDPKQVKNAIVYEGVREGTIGRNGEITSRADLDIIDTEQFKPQGDRLAGKFTNDAIDAFMAVIPRMGVNPAELRLQQQKIALEYAKLNDKQRENKYFGIDAVPYTQKVGGKEIGSGFMVPIDFAPIPSAGGKIVRFGKINGSPYVIEIVNEKQMVTNTAGDVVEINVPVEKGRKAKDSDLSLLRKMTDGLSDEYYKILPSSQRTATTSQSAAPAGFNYRAAEEQLFQQETGTGGEVWSPEMFGESQFSKPRIPTIPGITIIDKK
jgi:hypothetical protein